ncbi:MAG: stage III sporulation protein AD [Clostridia bacterium]|nr:stage III sporulation protein AD [Clostridia bacterium]
MNVIQIVSFAIVATMMGIVLKQYKPEYALLISIFAGVVILTFAVSKISTIISLLESLINDIGINKEFFVILIKITGIAYLIEFASNVCKDAGESAIASKVELAGKILIVTLSVPIISTLIETITEVI